MSTLYHFHVQIAKFSTRKTCFKSKLQKNVPTNNCHLKVGLNCFNKDMKLTVQIKSTVQYSALGKYQRRDLNITYNNNIISTKILFAFVNATLWVYFYQNNQIPCIAWLL
jgi:hypothetical protein